MERKSSGHRILLEVIDIPKPCPADWEEMRGDDRVRFCGHCSLNVYNLSAMGRAEAEAFIAKHEGQVCVRLHRRTDGMVMTSPCGWWAQARKRSRRLVAAGTALVIAMILTPFGLWPTARGSLSNSGAPLPISNPRNMTERRLSAQGRVAPIMLMGAIAPPRPASTQRAQGVPMIPHETTRPTTTQPSGSK